MDEDNNDGVEMGDVGNEADDDKFGKVMAGKQERSALVDIEKEGDNDCFV